MAVLDGSFSMFLDGPFSMGLIKYLNVEIFFHNNVDKIISSYI